MGKKAKDLGFVRDTLEKVIRLMDILEYLNTSPVLKDSLGLKGGTAINLTIFNLPRLSVDIDLDYLLTNSKEDMLEKRKIINDTIYSYMLSNDYSKNSNTKFHYSLDSFIYNYIGVSGNNDNIKLEVNYSLRSHILETEERKIKSEHFPGKYNVKSLSPIEIYGSKLNALINRAAARDLYDTVNMIQYDLFDESEKNMLKKSVIFYAAISSRDKHSINKTFDTKAIDLITQNKVRTDLKPVIKKTDNFELESAKKLVKNYISNLMILTENEKKFLDRFESGNYNPELLFEDKKILERIEKHPMALWKTREVK